MCAISTTIEMRAVIKFLFPARQGAEGNSDRNIRGTCTIPKCLNADQKRQWCQSSEQLLQFFQHDPNDFLSGTIGDHG
jgi:hypothetical protein